MRIPRWWSDSNFPRPRSPRYPAEKRTAMMCVLDGLAYVHRENPAELSTVLAAFARMGFPPLQWEYGMSHSGLSRMPCDETTEAWTRERCYDAQVAAMRGRRRDLLTARADGLLLAIEALADEVMEHRLHVIHVDVGLRECHAATAEERACAS